MQLLRPLDIDRAEAWRRLQGRFSVCLPTVERGGVLEWGRFYLPHYYTYAPSLMHESIARVLDRKFPRRAVRAAYIGPRGGAKSTVGTLTYALKQIAQGTEHYILIVSDTEGQAIEHLTNIKAELEDNETLATDYPFCVGQGPVWKENYIKTNNGVVVHAVGTGSKIRGRRIRQFRPSLIVLDDPENDGHIESEKQRGKVDRWFSRTLLNMGDESTNVLVLGSAMHRESLIMKLLTRPGWKSRREAGRATPFRAIESWPRNMKLWNRWERIYNNPSNQFAERDAKRFYKANKIKMDKGAVLCWPDKETLYDLMKLRAELGPAAFDAEKQGNPIDPASCEWPERYFTYDGFYFDEWPEDLIIKGAALDPSKGKRDKRHDYSAFAFGGISKDGIVYVDCDLDKRPTDAIVTDAIDLYQTFGPSCMAVESNQFQELLAQDIADEAERAGLAMTVLPIENFTAKTVRIRRLSSLLSQRRLRFRANSLGASLAVQQMRDFPNGDHDDGPDAVEMLCRMLFSKLEDEGENAMDEALARIMKDYQ